MTKEERKALRELCTIGNTISKEYIKDKLLTREPGQINGNDFNIRYLDNCKVYIHDHLAEVKVDFVNDSELVLGPCKSSVFIRNSIDSKFVVCCK